MKVHPLFFDRIMLYLFMALSVFIIGFRIHLMTPEDFTCIAQFPQILFIVPFSALLVLKIKSFLHYRARINEVYEENQTAYPRQSNILGSLYVFLHSLFIAIGNIFDRNDRLFWPSSIDFGLMFAIVAAPYLFFSTVCS